MKINFHTEIKTHLAIAQLLTESFCKLINEGRVITKKKRTDSEVVKLRVKDVRIIHKWAIWHKTVRRNMDFS